MMNKSTIIMPCNNTGYVPTRRPPSTRLGIVGFEVLPACMLAPPAISHVKVHITVEVDRSTAAVYTAVADLNFRSINNASATAAD
jgi:hypothetical protein